MAAEDHNRGRSPSVNPTKVDHSLDDLAKGLAGGTISRLEAVRLVGAALLGGALASVPGFAWAERRFPVNPVCEAYCIESFPAGPERAQCISQGAQGSGPCYECNEGLSPAAGPHLQCPPNTVFDPSAEFGTCCRTCNEVPEFPGVVCPDETGRPDCYSLQYGCGGLGTFDPSTCSCICQPGTINCLNSNGAPGTCVDPLSNSQHCGQCTNPCGAVSPTAACVNGVCVEPA